MSEKRFAHIDLLESIAIFLVIFYHMTLYDYNFLANSAPILYIRYLLRAPISVCVPVFFFVNGYLLLNKPINKRKHVRKIIRLSVLTVIWGIINILLLQVIKGEYFSLFDFKKILWCWEKCWINHLWYMGILICIYLLFPLLKLLFEKRREFFYLFTVICAVITFGAEAVNFTVVLGKYILSESDKISAVIDKVAEFDLSFLQFLHSIVYFCVGGIAKSAEEKLENVSSWKRNITAAICLVVSLLGWGFAVAICSRVLGYVWDVVWNGYDTVFIFIAVVCIYILSLNIRKCNHFTKIISCNTLGIYFMHQIFVHLAHPILIKYEWMRNMPLNMLAALIILSICLAICLALSKIPIISKLVK